MLRIAICDDQEHERNKTASMLQHYLQTRAAFTGETELFSSGSALLAAAKQRHFDLYILDILMPDLSGIETGRMLRQLGDGGEIIFLTNSNDFAADSYDIRAYFYLLKPVEEKKLFQVLDGAAEKLKRRRSCAVVVHTAEGPRRILLEHIRYVERTGRCIRYHCMDGAVDSLSIRVPFREAVAPLLADRRFSLCGASFVLNFQHVRGVNGQLALLDSGQAVSLPRTAAAEFKKAWGCYWLEEENLP